MLFIPQNRAVFPKLRMLNIKEAAVAVPRVACIVLPIPCPTEDFSLDLNG